MQPTDRLCQQRRTGQDIELLANARVGQAERRYRIGNDHAVDRRPGKRIARTGHEESVGDHRDDAFGAGFARGARGSLQGASGAQQIVDDECGGASGVACENIAADHAGTAVLVNEPLRHSASARLLQRFAKEFCPFHTARIGRDDAQLLLLQRQRIVHKERRSGEGDGRAAEGILESGRIVHVQRHNRVGARGLEQGSDIAAGHRIVWLGAPVFSRIAEVRYHGGHLRSPRVLERTDEEQEPAELVVGALHRASVKALDDVDRHPANGDERPCLVFAILEFPLLVNGKLYPERLRNGASQRTARLEREEVQMFRGQPARRRSKGGPKRVVGCHGIVIHLVQSREMVPEMDRIAVRPGEHPFLAIAHAGSGAAPTAVRLKRATRGE